VRKALKFVLVEHVEEVFAAALSNESNKEARSQPQNKEEG